MNIVYFRIVIAGLYIVLSTFSALHAGKNTTVRGVVFHDLNANGIRDGEEPGIPGVAVSNGIDVVVTDSDGGYTLAISDDAIVFVIKPGTYDYPVNAHNLPQFYYIHKPAGSPQLRYSGVEPSGPLPASVDFPLLTGSLSDDFSILVFSDPQPYTEEQIMYYDMDIVKELVGVQGHAFGITLGDIVGDNLDFFEPMNKATSRIGLPWFHVMGNHDMNFDAEKQEYADETFERVFGPSTYAFNQGKVHFLVLDDVIYPNTINDRFYVGGLREEQFRFIENSLRHVPYDHLVVLCMHIPLINEHPYGETFLNTHRQRLFDLLKDRPYTFSMSGHTHTQRHHFFGANEGWHRDESHHHYVVGTASGDWWSGGYKENGMPVATMRDGTPNGYNIIRFSGNQYIYDYKAAGKPDNYKMRLYGPKKVPHATPFRGELYVNFFQGSEKDVVEFRVNDGEWRRMSYFADVDPNISAIRYIWDHADTLPEGLRPSNPVISLHIWKTRVPSNLPIGMHAIHVRVKDVFGREYYDTYRFEIVAAVR